MNEIKFSRYNKTYKFNMFTGILLGEKTFPHQRVWIQDQAAYGVQSDHDLKVIELGISSSGVNTS